VVIARPKLFIFGAENTPRSYFNPDSSDTEMQVQTIYFNLIREAEVSMSIANQNEEWIAWPTVSSIPSRNQPYYSYKATWNGGTDNDGTYTYTIRAITIEDWNQWGEKARYSNEISLHRWE